MANSTKRSKKETIGVLVSGGFVSTALLDYCSKNYHKVVPIYIQMGFRWEESEYFWLKKHMRSLRLENVESLEVVQLSLRDLYQSHWSLTGVGTPNARSSFNEIFLAAREVMLLNRGALVCSSWNIPVLAIGYTKAHQSVGKTDQIMSHVQTMIESSLKTPLRIQAPFGEKARDEILFDYHTDGFHYDFSCLAPKGHLHCGECFKCQDRKNAFVKTSLVDKTQYYHGVAAVGAH